MTTAATDRFSGRRALAGDGLLRALSDATVLHAADVRTALTIGRLAGETDEAVLLAAALAVRAVRHGHVYVDLATIAATAAPDDGDTVPDVDWPDPATWPARVAASPLTYAGDDGDGDPPAGASTGRGTDGDRTGGCGGGGDDGGGVDDDGDGDGDDDGSSDGEDPGGPVELQLFDAALAQAVEPIDPGPAPTAPADGCPLRLVGSRLYLDRYWRHERAVVADLAARALRADPQVDRDVLRAGLDRLFVAGVDRQRLAAATAVLRSFSVVAGGPGTGKTTTVARILALLHEQAAALGKAPPRVALAAPTGKAAARLAEAIHQSADLDALDVDERVREALRTAEASTLHRLLGWNPGNQSRFRHHAGNPLPHDVVVVDESSMVPLATVARLLDAVRPDARLVFVGDPRQLASVEAGAVLGDVVGPAADDPALLLRPEAAAALADVAGVAADDLDARDPGPGAVVADGIVVLRRNHRFDEDIAALARAIERGDAGATVEVLRSGRPGVRWIEAPVPLDPGTSPALEPVRALVTGAAADVLAAAQAGDGRAALDALRSVQVLCAHRRGPAGAARWQLELERALRPLLPAAAAGHGPWYPGRPVLVLENDYGLGVFNGDTGVIVDTGGGRLRAVFDRPGRPLEIRPSRLASVDSLHAITIHKAQGSQFGTVVVVLPEPTSPILTRELLYTAVTRAEREVIVVASEDAVGAAVDRPVARASGLGDALWPSGWRPAG